MANVTQFVPHEDECWAPAAGSWPVFEVLEYLDEKSIAKGSKPRTKYILDDATWERLRATFPTLSHLPAVKTSTEADRIKALPPIVDPLAGKDNVTDLQDVSEASVLHTLKSRYINRQIYTNVSRIVIALNPFQRRDDLYSDIQIQRYLKNARPYDLPPHIFQIAATAYNGVTNDARDQSTLITGESGAGKTETTKLLLRFFATSFSGASTGSFSRSMSRGQSALSARIEDRVVMANPILEAFGNASTTRNPNSSRFGKWIEIQLNSGKRIQSASVTSYMLELPRVCEHSAGDRSYHIFYQMVKNKLGGIAEPVEAFGYLTPKNGSSGSVTRPELANVDDEKMFLELQKAFSNFDVIPHEQHAVFSLVAAVLRLGNIEFAPITLSGGAEGCSISVGDPIEVANLIGCEAEAVERCLVTRRLTVGRDVTTVPLRPDQAVAARDGLAKLIYGGLFKWLVDRINEGLSKSPFQQDPQTRFIGVLDIAGFERFPLNSFEQLLINLSNEKLQQQFNKDIIKSELEDYQREGFTDYNAASLDFVDNAPIVELLEGKRGVLDILDEELFVPKGNDASFVDKTVKNHATHNSLVPVKIASGTPSFTVVHFAGAVTYTVIGWLEKDRLAPPKEGVSLLENARNVVIKKIVTLLPPVDTKKKTVSTEFRRELEDLMVKIAATQVHYVRCIKANGRHQPGLVDSHEILRQLKCAGIMETIRIRKSGYAMRITLSDFLSRYAVIGGVGMPATVETAKWIVSVD